MLRGDASLTRRDGRANFHLQSAPLYVLTVVVAVLLVADWILGSGTSVGSVASDATNASVRRGLLSTNSFLGFRLALVAAVLGGARILYHALDGVLSGRFGADLALTVACLAAIVLGEHETAGLVVLVSLIGESLEGYTVDRARWAVRQTFALQPEIAHVASQNGQERDIPVEDVRVGDFVVVRPGERVPVDGSVIAGRSVVDQSAFTGESVPIDKVVGDRVFAGTLNQFGALTIVTESLGDQTALARMAHLVGTAQARKADLERMADRLSRWFLPCVLGIALLTWICWRIGTGSWNRGVLPALGVLVVACPCPLILATPCAVMAALAWLARRGVVVRGSRALERLAHVDTFAFDKTGTLTQGMLSLGEIHVTSSFSQNDVLRIAAIAERHSEHMLARLIVKSSEERGLAIVAPLEFEALPGAGVIATIRDETQEGTTELLTVIVGNRRALSHGEIEFSDEVAQLLKRCETNGELPLVVALDGQVIGVLSIRETMRPESFAVLNELRDAGIAHFALLTGDRSATADVVVKSIGLFDHVATEQLPADKARWIESVQQSGQRVAMVGDGTNDALALAVADVGVVLGRAGADLAADAGDILLMGDPLRPLPGLLRLSRALVQNIWQSIVLFAFGLNGLGVLACSLGWLSPVGAALFHEVASLAVMANSMRLLWFDGQSSIKVTRLINGLLSAADWLAVVLSPSKFVFRIIENRQLVAKLIAAVVLAGWFLSGVVILSNDEQAMVTRFGRYQESLDAGLHWRWPYPLEIISRESIGRLRSVEIGYRSGAESISTLPEKSETSRKSPGSSVKRNDFGPEIVEWTSSHGERDAEVMDGESLLLTADEVPVDLTAEVLYRIRDLKQFAFRGSRQPERVIRAAAESVLRDLASTAMLDDLLTDRRAIFGKQSLEELRQRIDRYSLGIEIVDLQWLDVHPPKAVVPAYRQVADALEDRELLVNEADAYADRILLGAVGEEALHVLKRSVTERNESSGNLSDAVVQPRVDWKLNDELWRQLSAEKPDGTKALSGSAAAILNDAQVSAVKRSSSAKATAGRFMHLLAENKKSPQLTGLKIYWDAVIETLSQRPLTIVDPKAANRQHLWLTDPVSVPMPPPVMRLPVEADGQ